MQTKCDHSGSSITIEGKDFKYLNPDQIHGGDLGLNESDMEIALKVLG
jgi:hypothetical protein